MPELVDHFIALSPTERLVVNVNAGGLSIVVEMASVAVPGEWVTDQSAGLRLSRVKAIKLAELLNRLLWA